MGKLLWFFKKILSILKFENVFQIVHKHFTGNAENWRNYTFIQKQVLITVSLAEKKLKKIQMPISCEKA